MRLLHVSDWHLGAVLGRVSREADHVEVLDEIVDVAVERRPHLIVHTGDLFDSARPPVDSMRLALDVLRRLSDVAPVVVLAGNHDSRALLRLLDQALAFSTAATDLPPVRFVTEVVHPDDGGILEYPGEGDEVIRLACMPFLHPNALVDIFETPPDGWTGKYADSIRLLQAMYTRGFEREYDNSRHVNLYAAHLHVGGAVLARSERAVHVSNDYAVDVEALPPVSYAAFGHIHKPQALPGTTPGRYAGSPIQLDYGEEGETKTVVAVEAAPGRAATVEVLDLQGGRPLVRVEGTLDQIRQRAGSLREPMILSAVVETDEPETGLPQRLGELFPDAALYNVSNRVAQREYQPVVEPDDLEREADFRALFADFLGGHDAVGRAQGERLRAHFETLLGQAEAETDFAIAAESELVGGTSAEDGT